MKNYILATPIMLAVSCYLVMTPYFQAKANIAEADAIVNAERVKAQSALDLVKFTLSVANEGKKFAMDEYDKCINDIETSYLSKWNDTCKRFAKQINCTLDEPNALNINRMLKDGKIECKNRFDMRMK